MSMHTRAEESATSSITLKLEVDRVDLLYRQNVLGLGAVIIYSLSYLYASWDIFSHFWLGLWFSVLMGSALVRVAFTYGWRRQKMHLMSLRELRMWTLPIQAMLLVSGCCWGAIAWFFTSSPSSLHQLFTVVSVIFMAAGAIVCYSASVAAMYCVIVPAMAGWAAGLWLSGDRDYRILGFLAVTYVLFGVVAGRRLHRYVLSALRLNVENAILAGDLRGEKQRLSMALESSGTCTWSWDLESDLITCEGSLGPLGKLDGDRITATFPQLLQFVAPSERERLSALIHSFKENGGELDTEVLANLPGDRNVCLTLRGRALAGPTGQIARLTGVFWDATKKKSEDMLRHERDVHQAANKAKSLFLASVSHEIRTPLTSILGFAETLLQEQKLDSTQRSDLEVILRNGKHLTALVGDLLDLAKIETGKLYLQKSIMSPEREIEDAVLTVRTQLEAKHLTVTLDFSSNLPQFIECDATRFRQIAINLLSNAVKFTSAGGITVKASFSPLEEGTAGTLRLSVADTGIGVAGDVRPRLFEPFARGDSPDVKRAQGSGLGLALSRDLARMLGGELRLVHSETGHGSEFELSLNVKTVSPAAALNSPSTAEASRTARDPSSLAGAKILVVEDSLDLQELLIRQLVSYGALVSTCDDGEQGVSAALESEFDVVLMDINMPVLNGYEATARLRAAGYKAPIIALTAHANDEDRELCFKAGCDGYLSKPIDFAHLIRTVQRCAGAALTPSSEQSARS